VAKCRSRAEQKKLRYEPVQVHRPEVPFWVDEAIGKALQPDAFKRYEDVAEFVYSLQRPDRAFLGRKPLPLIERNPVIFWKSISLLLALTCLVLLGLRLGS
jgi:hypothetical protein